MTALLLPRLPQSERRGASRSSAFGDGRLVVANASGDTRCQSSLFLRRMYQDWGQRGKPRPIGRSALVFSFPLSLRPLAPILMPLLYVG